MSCKHILKNLCGCKPEEPSILVQSEAPGARKWAREIWHSRNNPEKLARILAEKAAEEASTVVEVTEEPTVEDYEETDLAQQIIWACSDPTTRAEYLRELDAEAARSSFKEYVRQAWHVVEQSTELSFNWHHELMCDVLQGMFEDWERGQDTKEYVQRVQRALFNVPPGSLKSRIIAVMFPTWVWTRRPGCKFICLSVNEDATMRDARDSRAILKSPWYARMFQPTWELQRDQDAVSNYANSAGGSRLSRAQGSEIVGLRADILLIDDPNNPHEAESKRARDEVNELWETNIANRVNDLKKSLWIGVQQRTNAGDWSGYLLKTQQAWGPSNLKGWLHVVLPAEFEVARRCVTPWGSDPRTFEGETIHHDRLPPDILESERKRFGSAKYAGQMQQRPAMVEGGRVKRAWWNWCRLTAGIRDDVDGLESNRPRPAHTTQATPRVVGKATYKNTWDFDWIVISVDPAAKKTERGSNYGILVVAGQDERRYVLDDRSCRGDILDILKVLKDLVRLWEPDRMLIEAKAAGPDLMTLFQEQLAAGDVVSNTGKPLTVVVEAVEPGNADKEMRLDACIPTIEAGQVYLLDGSPWLEDFIEELSLFPNGSWDDRVDALSQCLNHIRAASSSLPSW